MSNKFVKVITFVGALAIASQPAHANAGGCGFNCSTVPEPTSIALTSVGMAMVGAMAVKRNRKK